MTAFDRLAGVRLGAVLPPYKNALRLQKCQKSMQRVWLFVVIDVILVLDHNKEVLLMHLLAPL